ncbi:MAG: bifunctional pyr operon transcriptional regulator/uracil phosphoribosyltransferase PyrR [Rhodothermales bacterium]
MARSLMLSPERIRRTIVRLAFEIIEVNRGAQNLIVFGIRNGGAAIAEALLTHINAREGCDHRVHTLDVTPFRDDQDWSENQGTHIESGIDVTDRDVILVDDVLFTGRTARAALDAIVRGGRPRSIQLVVLIDRGHREYPIQPNFVGRVIKTKHKERVEVEVEEDFSVYVEE